LHANVQPSNNTITQWSTFFSAATSSGRRPSPTNIKTQSETNAPVSALAHWRWQCVQRQPTRPHLQLWHILARQCALRVAGWRCCCHQQGRGQALLGPEGRVGQHAGGAGDAATRNLHSTLRAWGQQQVFIKVVQSLFTPEVVLAGRRKLVVLIVHKGV
jgi:hypothetical protein